MAPARSPHETRETGEGLRSEVRDFRNFEPQTSDRAFLAGWFCTVTWEGASFRWKAGKSLDPGSTGDSQKSGENQGYRVDQEGALPRPDVQSVQQGTGMSIRNLVPKAGLEPARLAPHAPQTCVSAIPPLRQPNASSSTGEALCVQLRGSGNGSDRCVRITLQRKRIIEVVQNACQSTSCPVESDACCAGISHIFPHYSDQQADAAHDHPEVEDRFVDQESRLLGEPPVQSRQSCRRHEVNGPTLSTTRFLEVSEHRHFQSCRLPRRDE